MVRKLATGRRWHNWTGVPSVKLLDVEAVMAATTLDAFSAQLDAGALLLHRDSEAYLRNRALARLNNCSGALVYFIQCNGDWGPVKIGRTRNIQQRLVSIQLHNPYPLRVLCTLAGGDIMERAMHKRFAHARVTGEWFWPSRELMSFIKDLNWLLQDQAAAE